MGAEDPSPSGMSAEPTDPSEPAVEPRGTEPTASMMVSRSSGPNVAGSMLPSCAPAGATEPRVRARASAPAVAVAANRGIPTAIRLQSSQ